MINPFLDRLDSQNIILCLLSESLLLQQTKWEKAGTVSEFINIHQPLNFQLLFSPSAAPGCPSPLILLYIHQSNGETYMGVEVRGQPAVSVLPLYGFQESNSGCQTWWQVPFVANVSFTIKPSK